MGMGFDMGSLTHALDATPKDPPTGSKTISEAIQFVNTVKREFHGERGKYEEFLSTLRQYKLGSISVADVANRIKVLFAGHPDLVRGFNVFMPYGKEIKVDQEAAEEAPAAGVARK